MAMSEASSSNLAFYTKNNPTPQNLIVGRIHIKAINESLSVAEIYDNVKVADDITNKTT